MPSTNRPRSSGCAWIRGRRRAARRRTRRSRASASARPARASARAGRRRSSAEHLGGEAVEERGVARLVDELGGQEDLDLAARRGAQERRQVGGHPLLADRERRRATRSGPPAPRRASPPSAPGRRRSRSRAPSSSGAPRARRARRSRAARPGRSPPRGAIPRCRRGWPAPRAGAPRARSSASSRPCERSIQRPSSVIACSSPRHATSWSRIATLGDSSPATSAPVDVGRQPHVGVDAAGRSAVTTSGAPSFTCTYQRPARVDVVADDERVPARPGRVDQVGQRAVDRVGVELAAVAQRVGDRHVVGVGQRAQLRGLAAAAADAHPPGQHQLERRRRRPTSDASPSESVDSWKSTSRAPSCHALERARRAPFAPTVVRHGAQVAHDQVVGQRPAAAAARPRASS